MGEKQEITQAQTFFPESLKFYEKGRSPGLRIVVCLLVN